MHDYHCTACNIRFEAEGKARCPSCFRVSTVVEGAEPRGFRTKSWRQQRGLWIAAALVALTGLGGALALWLASEHSAPSSPGQPARALRSSLDDLPRDVRAGHAHLLDHGGANYAAAVILGGVPTDSIPHALSAFLSNEHVVGRLHVITSDKGRRVLLIFETLADGALISIADRHGAYLYPFELTLLISTIATQLHVEHDFVLLSPDDARVDALPVVALRFTKSGWALDPSTGLLRDARDAQGKGLALPWAARAWTQARHALRHAHWEEAHAGLKRSARLVPDLWMARATQAELALSQGDLAAAQRAVEGLVVQSDHPYAWFIEARVDAAGAPTPEQANTIMEAKLNAIVEAFPLEAQLCVELGDRQRARGAYREALKSYRRALARDPEVEAAHAGIGRLYAGSDPEQAYTHLREELSAHPANTDAYLTLAFVHALHDETTDTERALVRGRAVTSSPKDFDAKWRDLSKRADTLRRERERREAP